MKDIKVSSSGDSYVKVGIIFGGFNYMEAVGNFEYLERALEYCIITSQNSGIT